MNLMDQHEEEIMACVRDNFAKDEEVTQTKVSARCHIPHTTINKRLPNIVDKPLGDGTKVVKMRIVRFGLVKDPPGKNEILEESRETEEHESHPWKGFGLGLVAGGLISAFMILTAAAFRNSHGHGCSWSHVPRAESWVLACTICGRVGYNLNDLSAPIHFFPVES